MTDEAYLESVRIADANQKAWATHEIELASIKQVYARSTADEMARFIKEIEDING